MSKSYSITEAKNHFTELIGALEHESVIQITRRGKPVAVLLSPGGYEHLQKGKIDFWEAYLAFRKRLDLAGLDLDIDKIYADVRDRSPGREVDWE